MLPLNEKCASTFCIKLGAKGSGLRQEQVKAANDEGAYIEERLKDNHASVLGLGMRPICWAIKVSHIMLEGRAHD